MQKIDFTQHPTTIVTLVFLDYLSTEKGKSNIKACKQNQNKKKLESIPFRKTWLAATK